MFRSEIPLEIAAIFLKLSSRGIDHYQTSDSLNIYTIGNLRDIKSANNLKDEVIQKDYRMFLLLHLRVEIR